MMAAITKAHPGMGDYCSQRPETQNTLHSLQAAQRAAECLSLWLSWFEPLLGGLVVWVSSRLFHWSLLLAGCLTLILTLSKLALSLS